MAPAIIYHGEDIMIIPLTMWTVVTLLEHVSVVADFGIIKPILSVMNPAVEGSAIRDFFGFVCSLVRNFLTVLGSGVDCIVNS